MPYYTDVSLHRTSHTTNPSRRRPQAPATRAAWRDEIMEEAPLALVMAERFSPYGGPEPFFDHLCAALEARGLHFPDRLDLISIYEEAKRGNR